MFSIGKGLKRAIFWCFFGTARERIAKRTLREQEARVRTEEATIERERNAELLKQIKDNEYAGRRQLRAEIEKMPKYSNWRSTIFDKCGRKCEMCGVANGLEIHHRTSFDSLLKSYKITTAVEAFECDALWNINNGSVLCKECHSKMESSKYHESKQRKSEPEAILEDIPF